MKLQFKVYGLSVDSALFPQGFTVGRNAITFPKIGTYRFQSRKNIHKKKIHNLTVSYDRPRNRWIVSICYEKTVKALPKTGKKIGLDAGAVRLVTDNEGHWESALKYQYPKTTSY